MGCQYIAGHHAHTFTLSFTPMGDLAKPIHLPALGGGRETGEPTGNPQTQGEHVKLNTDSNPSTGLNQGALVL